MVLYASIVDFITLKSVLTTRRILSCRKLCGSRFVHNDYKLFLVKTLTGFET